MKELDIIDTRHVKYLFKLVHCCDATIENFLYKYLYTTDTLLNEKNFVYFEKRKQRKILPQKM